MGAEINISPIGNKRRETLLDWTGIGSAIERREVKFEPDPKIDASRVRE